MRARFLIAVLGLGVLATSALANPDRWSREWPNTDFENTSVENWNDILSGGPPKDGIPSLSDPSFIAVAKENRIEPREAVISVEIDGETPRAYPIRYLTWHEIVNDEVGGVPIAVTFCPLCNSGMVFDRRVNGQLRSFGVSGKLRNSDMVMFDRETESWWQQALGEGIVGVHTGDKLVQLPAWMESWEEFTSRNPDGLVMDQPSHPRSYGRNPYISYDSSARPFLYNGENPPHDVPPLMRVVRIGERAWTLQRLRDEGEVSEAGVVISWASGQASALDAGTIGGGKDVGTIRVRDGAGKDVPHDVMFAFAFHAFWPDGEWMLPN
ncbi:MAG: DUF3179 domain-containing protein [Marinosulfonomonas sp.]|nr:DUF3179 domain-containing protein [Marinosulfonomonas sp.]